MLEELSQLERIPNEEQMGSWRDWFRDSSVTVTNDFCDVDEFESRTSWSVQNFFECDIFREPTYSESTIEQRAEYIKDFHENFSAMSGYSGNLHFSDTMEPNNLGAFNPLTKRIDLNADLLRDADPRQVMETVMHESRHAFQDFAINNPEKVSVDRDTIKTWKYNFDHYIRPEFDYEAYYYQPVEADANEFATRMYEEGKNHMA